MDGAERPTALYAAATVQCSLELAHRSSQRKHRVLAVMRAEPRTFLKNLVGFDLLTPEDRSVLEAAWVAGGEPVTWTIGPDGSLTDERALVDPPG